LAGGANIAARKKFWHGLQAGDNTLIVNLIKEWLSLGAETKLLVDLLETDLQKMAIMFPQNLILLEILRDLSRYDCRGNCHLATIFLVYSGAKLFVPSKQTENKIQTSADNHKFWQAKTLNDLKF
jgi:hypothetical protein